MITIIDYGSGNLKSISNGFTKIGAEVKISSDPQDMRDCEGLVLPGVGSFGAAMHNLADFSEVIHKHIQDDKPFLGVCLGLQVLFTSSQESPNVTGLDIFKGEVKRFPQSIRKMGLKIPHMGWNSLNLKKNCPVLDGVGSDFMYFVHSFYIEPKDKKIIAATVDYGFEVPAVIGKDNVFATQFHPEKSGSVGLKILRNFVNLIE
jgi:glutamine amidotransferase